jgi:hypothetical protein
MPSLDRANWSKADMAALAVANKKLLKCTCQASGSLGQTITVWIVASPPYNGSERSFDLGPVRPLGRRAP